MLIRTGVQRLALFAAFATVAARGAGRLGKGSVCISALCCASRLLLLGLPLCLLTGL